MRIALFTDTYPDDINGVAGTLGMLVAHATGQGHEMALVTPRVSAGGAAEAHLHSQLPGIPVPIYPDLQLARGIDRKGSRALRDFSPDVVHVATESTVGFSGRRWALRHGVPLVTSFHTNFPAYVASYHARFLEPWVWRYLRWFHAPARATLCPSQATRDELEERGFHDRLGIWSRGVRLDLFDPERRSEEIRHHIAPGAERILLYVGRIAAEKKVDFVLDAYERVRARSKQRTALVFVGDGPATAALRRRAPADVHFTGFLRGEALARAYAAADLFVFASETETFGNVVLEALASGVPVVAVNRGGPSETVVPGRTGVLAPPGDLVAFSDACIGLLENEDERRRLSDGARAEALSRDWAVVLDGVLDVWEEATSGPEVGGSATVRAARTGARRTSAMHPLSLSGARRR